MKKVKTKKKVKKKQSLKVSKKPKRKPKSQATSSHKPLRDSRGKLLPGQCGNPKGRPKGTGNKYSIADLHKAIESVEKTKDKSFLEVWIEAAWGDATDMAVVANFMMPKLRAIEQVTFAADSMDDEEAKQIRAEMLKRFGGK